MYNLIHYLLRAYCPHSVLSEKARWLKSNLEKSWLPPTGKAFHEYFILEKLEAGISLFGTEVKAIREGRLNLKDSYATHPVRRSFPVQLPHQSLFPRQQGESRSDSSPEAAAAPERNPKAHRKNSGKRTDTGPPARISEARENKSGAGRCKRQEADRQARNGAPQGSGPRSKVRHEAPTISSEYRGIAELPGRSAGGFMQIEYRPGEYPETCL